MVARETSLTHGLQEMGIPASDQVIRRLAKLADVLENDAVDLGFLGPNEGQRVVSRHLLESAALAPHLIRDGPIVDVGSGAGLPGLVLAALGLKLVLIEAQSRRADFMRRISADLGLDVDVRCARAEDEGRKELRDSAGTVVARALAAPAVAFELCLPFVRVGGRLLLATSPQGSDGPDRLEELPESGALRSHEHLGGAEERDVAQATENEVNRSARVGALADPPGVPPTLAAVADQLGAAAPRWERLSVPGVDEPRWVMIVDKRDPTPDRFPRRSGVPKRRPLGGDVASVD